MARAVYAKYRTLLLSAPPNLSSTNIVFVLTDHAGTDGAPDTALDDFYDDIDGSTVGALSGNAANKTLGTVAAGVFDCDNITFTAVSGASVESFSCLRNTGAAATSDLLSYWDDATGLPVTPNGGDITLTFSASGVFTT